MIAAIIFTLAFARNLANKVSEIGIIILITTISAVCICAWIYVIKNWKRIFKKIE